MRDIIIQVNNNCTLRCPYCFAYTETHEELSISNMRKLLLFCHRNDIERIKITGGEPFLYTHITEFINSITEFTDAMIFSNLMVPDCFKDLKNKSRIKVLANLNEPDFYTNSQLAELQNNIDYAVASGITVIPGRTFYHAPYQIDDIITICEKYGLKTIRVSQANPTVSKNNTWLSAQEINRFLVCMGSVSEQIKHKGIRLDFDCPIAPCLINKEIYSYFFNKDELAARCGTKIVIKPDLTIEHCYITAPITKTKTIFDYESYDAAFADINNQLSQYRRSVQPDKCNTCEYKCDIIPCGCYGFMDLLAGGIENE